MTTSDDLSTGALTPRSNTTVHAMRLTGNFGQPDGFGSVLTARVRESGGLGLSLKYRMNGEIRSWGVELDNEQRKALGAMILSYDPVLFETSDERLDK